MTTKPDVFERALDALLDGDLSALDDALEADPDLVAARAPWRVPPWDGYFHRATLLHHVAGNPRIRPLPRTMLRAARRLLDAGADVDAVTAAGPTQPGDIGWTTLGLAATSGDAREAGFQIALMDLLIEAGADLDARNGGALMGALYSGEGEAARHLARAGARVDTIAAAGLGDLDRLATFLALDDATLAAAPRLAHYARVPWPTDAGPDETATHVRGMALVYAALHDRTEAIHLLLEAGADPNHRPPFEHGATALHWAVLGDAPGAVGVLLDAGA
ncbi:MAG: ankyrin repeat domain-containing protein, partial [Longimicrobiales bacterium]